MQETMNIGERRHIKLLIHSTKNETFQIQSAEYELVKKYGDEPEDSGACSITEHIIDTVIQPKEIGSYQLKIKYTIADEILVDIVEVAVV